MKLGEEQLSMLEKIGNDLLSFVAEARRPAKKKQHPLEKEGERVEKEFGIQARQLVYTLALFEKLVKKATRKYKKREPKMAIMTGLAAELSSSTVAPLSDEKDCDMAIDVIRNTRRASTSHFQRQLGWGYNHAAKIIDMLEDRGIIGPQVGAGPREIIQLPKRAKGRRRK